MQYNIPECHDANIILKKKSYRISQSWIYARKKFMQKSLSAVRAPVSYLRKKFDITSSVSNYKRYGRSRATKHNDRR